MRSRLLHLVLTFVFIIPLHGTTVRSAEPGKKTSPRKQADSLTKEALHREAYGDTQGRKELLKRAAEADPKFLPAKWHQGMVRFQNRWIDTKQVSKEIDKLSRYQKYEKQREASKDDLQGHLALAQFCRESKLPAQERAHLFRVLDFMPNHEATRARLGFRRIDGRWVSGEQLSDQQRTLNQRQQSLRKWQKKLVDMRERMSDRSLKRREHAALQLRTINDPSAIPAMEAVFLNAPESSALAHVTALSEFPQFEAAQSLARVGVFSPHAKVRAEASRQLKTRKPNNYVPLLLQELATPILARKNISRGPQGQIIFRQEFIREEQNERRRVIVDTTYERVARANGNRSETVARAFDNMRMTTISREERMRRQNELAGFMNQRIGEVLTTATGQALGAEPKEWWSWWSDYNEVFTTGEKPVSVSYRRERVVLVDRPVSSEGPGDGSEGPGGSQSTPPPPSRRCDCLAAGTPVWTARGPRSIEKMRVGDLVLSQHPETGELTYKPVIRTTIRPKSELVRIRAGGQVLETSGGHLFWVSGEGWVKSREIQSGMVLHTPKGVLHVSRVERGSVAQTYNVIVADFHTYFAGEGRVLSHDNTIRKYSNTTVPGLKVE